MKAILCFVVAFFAAVSFVSAESNPELNANHRLFQPETGPDERSEAFLEFSRSQLQTSTWPLDHGDTARSKYVMDAGLPVGVTSKDIKVISNLKLNNAQWLYTAGENSEWLFVMNGAVTDGFKVSKLNATTLEIVQEMDLEPALYTGGMLIHRNGHVYAIHSNMIYAYWSGDIHNCTKFRIPTTLNGGFTLTNGMLVTSDGLLLVKQWSGQLTDLYFITASKPAMIKIWNALIFVFTAITFFTMRRRRAAKLPAGQKLSNVKQIGIGFISAFLGYILATVFSIVVIIVLAENYIQYFNPIRFVTDSLFSFNSGGGELKLIDPISLTVVASAQLPERCSFARMALSTVVNPEGVLEDAIVLLGDENVHQYRWRPSTGELFWVSYSLSFCCS
jgi:hypothetical protein